MEIKWIVALIVIVILALASNNEPAQSTQPSSCPEFESFQNDFITSNKEIQNTITYPQEAINYQVGVRYAGDAIYQTVPSNVFLVKGVPNGTDPKAVVGIRDTLGGKYEIRNITPSSIRCNGDYIFYFVGTIKDLVEFEDRSSPYDVLYSVSYKEASKVMQSSINILPLIQTPFRACGDEICQIGETESNCPVDCSKPKPDIEKFTKSQLEDLAYSDAKNIFNTEIKNIPVYYVDFIGRTDKNGETDGFSYIKIRSGLDNTQTFRALSHEYCHVADFSNGCQINQKIKEPFCETYALIRLGEKFGISLGFSTEENYYMCLEKQDYDLSCMNIVYGSYTCGDIEHQLVSCGIDISALDRCLNG